MKIDTSSKRYFVLVQIVTALSFVMAMSITISSAIAKPAEEATATIEHKLIQESRAALNEERQLLEKQADRHFSHLDNFVNRVIYGLGILAVVAGGLLFWAFGRTRNEMQKTIHELFEREAKSLIEQEADQLRQRYQELKAQVDDLSAYRERSVTWVFPGETISGQIELEALYSMGLRKIQTMTPAPKEMIDIGTPDLVIFTYDGTDEGRRLLNLIVQKLKNETPPVFLIIYTYNPSGTEVRINKEERDILAGFHWYVPANFPSQLVLQTQLLIRRGRSFVGGDLSGQL